jgi:hypothetical protein
MTKAFDFSSKEVQRHQSAHNVIGVKSAFNVSDLLNNHSSKKIPKGVADLPGYEPSTLDSMGSINIKTNNRFDEVRDRVARVVDLNKNTSFPLTQ